MNNGKFDIQFIENVVFYLLIYNELSNIDQLLMIKNTMNIITILQPSNFIVFLHGYFLQCMIICEPRTR